MSWCRQVFESLIFTAISVAIVFFTVLMLATSRADMKKLIIAMILVALYWVATYIVSFMVYVQPLTVAYVNTTTVVTLTVRTVISGTATSVATPATAYMSIPITVYTTNPEAQTITNVGLWATVIMVFMLLFYAFAVLSRRLRV
jgi:hypothetical protein